jgi:hypothetical protein
MEDGTDTQRDKERERERERDVWMDANVWLDGEAIGQEGVRCKLGKPALWV